MNQIDLSTISLDELRDIIEESQKPGSPWGSRFREIEAELRKKAGEAAFEHVAKRKGRR